MDEESKLLTMGEALVEEARAKMRRATTQQDRVNLFFNVLGRMQVMRDLKLWDGPSYVYHKTTLVDAYESLPSFCPAGDIDQKFNFYGFSKHSGKPYSQVDAVMFLARDPAFLDSLPAYRLACVARGASEHQLKSIDLLTERVRLFQESNPSQVKVADVDPEKEDYLLK